MICLLVFITILHQQENLNYSFKCKNLNVVLLKKKQLQKTKPNQKTLLRDTLIFLQSMENSDKFKNK